MRTLKAWQNLFSGYSFIDNRLPEPEAGNQGFETLGLWEFSPIGWGIYVRQNLRETEPRQLMAYQAVMVQGLGGLSAGQVIMQPLINQAQTSYLTEPTTSGVQYGT
jgi:hypothetical protein